jgi:hypothetical protein
MAGLLGAQKRVLQAVQDSSQDFAGFVGDTEIAQATNIAIKDVREWLETPENEGYIEVARTTAGLSTAITAQGKLAIDQYRPFPTVSTTPAAMLPADRRGIDQRQGEEVIDSSGNWVLLRDHFFEAKSVKQGSGLLTVVIPSRDSEDDVALQALSNSQRGVGSSVAFAHRNDAWVVAVEDVESESVGDGLDGMIRLRTKDHSYGGGPASSARSSSTAMSLPPRSGPGASC